ncbi:hypothetical protein C8J57DRAFT_1277577 [Mycena rebaudengoi]|nr:hypothetical protein C8J57DRAFT_1277577 [Mycena rebaudengoi]
MEHIDKNTATVEDSQESGLGPIFPPELLQLIIEHLRYDDETLGSVSLASKQCLSICRPYIFSHVVLISNRPESRPCFVLYKVLSQSPHIASYIRHVTISSALNAGDGALRWLTSLHGLPLLLDLLRSTDSCRVQSFHIRLSGNYWTDIPEDLRVAIRSFISSPSILDVDFTGFDVLDLDTFNQCSSLKRIKFSEIDFVESSASGLFSAKCESVTILDTTHVETIISWIIRSPSFHALRDLRLAFQPRARDDVGYIENLLLHVSDTLESLHLQPVYTVWPIPSNFINISSLRALKSLRLSLGLSEGCNPFPWVVFVLTNLGLDNTIRHLTVDLRAADNAHIDAFSWADLDAALTQLPGLQSLVVTYHDEIHRATIVEKLKQTLLDRLPRTRARDIFEARELNFPRTRFFYWPGPLNWLNSVYTEEKYMALSD